MLVSQLIFFGFGSVIISNESEFNVVEIVVDILRCTHIKVSYYYHSIIRDILLCFINNGRDGRIVIVFYSR